MEKEVDILKLFQEGNVKPFYVVYYAPLVLFAKQLLGDERDIHAEDCVQDAIFEAWQRRNSFSTIELLRSYIYTSIKNKAINLFKKDKSQERYLSNYSEISSNEYIDAELMSIIHEAIVSLPEKPRKVIELSYLNEFKNAEIAQIMNVSESSVKKFKAYGLSLLKRRLGQSF